jgi:chromosome partitioning protein
VARIIAVTNQKGGVGKTTTAVNLAACLAANDRRVLLIDLDPQANATTGSGVDKSTLEASTCEVLLGEVRAMDAILPIEAGGYALMPSSPDLTAAEVRLLQVIGREMKLRQALEAVDGMYDYIFIDCPPSINMLTLNALTAAQGVLIPIQCEYYALEGLSSLLETVRQIRNSVNPKIEIEGLLRTMYDPRNRLATEVSSQLLKHFGDKVYDSVIPRNVRLAEAPSYGVPVLIHDPRSRGSEAYSALALEIISHENPASQAGAA